MKPGGAFISSTACIGDSMKLLRYVVPLGMLLGVMPYVNVFTTQQLIGSLASAGFGIDHQWQPGKGKAVFVVALRPA